MSSGEATEAFAYRWEVLRRWIFLLSPRWLLLYAAVAAGTTAMVLMGRWQLERAHERHGNLQNYSYVLQWWAFSAFVLFMLGRIVRDALQERRKLIARQNGEVIVEENVEPAGPPGYRRYVPPSAPTDVDDVTRSYNDYLARLNDGETKKQ